MDTVGILDHFEAAVIESEGVGEFLLGDVDAGDFSERVGDFAASAGGFGLWGPFSTSELWLDSYVTEFLLRAKAEGYEVPELAMTMALVAPFAILYQRHLRHSGAR